MSRTARPIIIEADDSDSSILERVSLGKDSGYDERWLQSLIFKHPECLPFDEIEAGLGHFYSVCTELPISSGYVDNVLVSPEGVLAVVETKLWRNPEARRIVIAQALDYASSLFTMDYESLEKAVQSAQSANGQKPSKILDCFAADDVPNEAEFIDAVNTNLRRGRLIVLVAGDGIRTELASLVDTLQSHAGLRFTFGLVEMNVFRMGDGRHVVHPRTLAKTVMIERGVVRIEEGRVVIDEPKAVMPSTISSESFFEDMAAFNKDLPAHLRGFLNKLSEIGVQPEFKKTITLRYTSPEGTGYNFGNISRNGELWTTYLDDPKRLCHDVARRYIVRLAKVFDGRVDNQHEYWYVRKGAKVPNIGSLVNVFPEWIEEIKLLIQAIRAEEIEDGAGRGVFERHEAQLDDTSEVILEVGGEGGSIKLLGLETNGQWAFKVSTGESALLDEDDLHGHSSPERPWVASWETALEQLDQYPWAKLYPLSVHPKFSAKVMAAVMDRIGSDNQSRWSEWQSVLNNESKC